ncbi:xanthine dehydrogenase family protein molybdopterin-binding subunit [Leekyejoonella antrihumi]|uniref:Xanthine dehydrogenase family protein molybdopterin-binding subunit n=2 Tax=Leekyejoonella antrihumi TaxID=1660198 RepID=A0A563DXN4_9MICO|nr:xanthine dehydrogenase family protein molybdopterin-binding subunit [Leekyejoonella antrihumi]
MLEVAFLRSPVAHARIHEVDLTAAAGLPGVVAVYNAAALVGRVEPLLNSEELRIPEGIRSTIDPVVRIQPMPLLASGEVNYVGQAIAMVVAESRYLAEDALEVIDVRYDELPAVIDPEAALEEGSPRVLLEAEDNIGIHLEHGTGDVDQALRSAAVIVEDTFASQRYVPSPMECRGIVAHRDPFSGRLTVWSNTQTPHRVRGHIASCLGLPADDVHVVAVDVGGGFGQKGILVVEELLIPLVAQDLGRPVRWTEDRQENLTAGSHAREQIHHITAAADESGRLLAVRDRFVVNLGARNMVGLVVPYNSLCHLIGPYRVPNVQIEATGALTNTMFTSPYRGAGRPEATFAMERIMDRLAAKLEMEPAELRARNVVTPQEMPYQTGLLDRRGLTQQYDSGDYPEMLDRAVKMIDLPRVRTEQQKARVDGRYVGVGFAMYLEATALGPFEGAKVSVLPSGRIRIHTGAPSQGQGHRTTFVQIAADALGVEMGEIELVAGDTATIPFGVGTIASRALVTAENAIHQAAVLVRQRILDSAAELMEVDPADLEIADNQVVVKGSPGSAMSLAELMRAIPMTQGGSGRDGLSEVSYFQPPNYATSSGLHAVVVEVQPATGRVEILDYVVVHEAGRIVNPQIADAQIVGGTAQGIGGALLEHMQYDEAGQPVTSTFMDYRLPTVDTVPDIRLAEVVCPSPTNALGVKGLGEGGAVGPPAALANAVEDALSPFGVVIHSCPLTPDRLWALLRAGRATER